MTKAELQRAAIVVMWGLLTVFGIAALVLAQLRDPLYLGFVLVVVMAGCLVATLITMIYRQGRRASS